MIVLSQKRSNNCFPDLRFALFLNTSTEFGLDKSNDSSLHLALVLGESMASCVNLRVPIVRLFLREAARSWFLSVKVPRARQPLFMRQFL